MTDNTEHEIIGCSTKIFLSFLTSIIY